MSKYEKLSGAEVIDMTTPVVLKRFSIDGPVCMIGSESNRLDEKEIARLRRLFDSNLSTSDFIYVTDDIGDPKFADQRRILTNRFGLVLCGSLLEHVKRPWIAAENIERLLRPGGHLRYTGTWVWGYHPYPDDYWRISISGLRVLFPNVQWLEWWYSGTNKGVGVRIQDIVQERKVFQQIDGEMKPLAEEITNRSMPYLKIEAVGQR